MTSAISVVVPLFNKAPLVAESLRRALEQSLPPAEIIVVDDGSTDRSAEIVLALQDPRLRLIRQENSGVSAARNRGVSEASQPWIAFLDADDIWAPDHLETLSRAANSEPRAVLVGTSFVVGPDAGSLPEDRGGSAARPISVEEALLAAAGTGPLFWTSALMARGDLAAQHPFPVGCRIGEDQDVWFRILQGGLGILCERVTAVYIQADSEGAMARPHPSDWDSVVMKEWEAWKAKSDAHRRFVEKNQLDLILRHLRKGDVTRAAEEFRRREFKFFPERVRKIELVLRLPAIVRRRILR